MSNVSIFLALVGGMCIGACLMALIFSNCKKCKVSTANLKAVRAELEKTKLDLSAKIAECERESGSRKAAEASLAQRMDNIAELGRLRREDEASLKQAQQNSDASSRIKALAAQWQRIKPYLKKHAKSASNNAIRDYNKDVATFKQNPKAVKRWIDNETVPTKITLFK